MTDQEIERISRDIEDLKKAVKRNDPLLHELTAPPGWIALSLVAGISISLFALPAHILSRVYGSFDAIPTGLKALLFCAIAIFAVGGGVAKMVLMTRKLNELQPGGEHAISRLMASFFGGRFAHTTIPPIAVIAALIAFSVVNGTPWLMLPFTALVFGLLLNQMGERSAVRSYYIGGYWSLVTGGLSLFLASGSVFLWLFIIYGGMFFAFSASLAAEKSYRREKRA